MINRFLSLMLAIAMVLTYSILSFAYNGEDGGKPFVTAEKSEISPKETLGGNIIAEMDEHIGSEGDLGDYFYLEINELNDDTAAVGTAGLYESRYVVEGGESGFRLRDNVVTDLNETDLSKTDLSEPDLNGTDLNKTDLNSKVKPNTERENIDSLDNLDFDDGRSGVNTVDGSDLITSDPEQFLTEQFLLEQLLLEQLLPEQLLPEQFLTDEDIEELIESFDSENIAGNRDDFDYNAKYKIVNGWDGPKHYLHYDPNILNLGGVIFYIGITFILNNTRTVISLSATVCL